MKKALILLLLVGFPASADASAYDTFLNRLDGTIANLARGGWTSRDVEALQRDIAARPSADAASYKAFTQVLQRTLSVVEPGGIVSKEVEIVKLVASVAPRAQIGNGDHQRAFFETFAQACERLSSGGFVSREVEIIRIIASAAPTKTVPPSQYDAAYASWSNQMSRVEQKLSRGGLVSNEKEVLDVFRSLQPQKGTVVASPTINPPPSTGNNGHKYCGKRIRVKSETTVPSRGRGPARLLVTTERGHLIEIDTGVCAESWIASGVESVVTLGRHVAVLQRDGTALLFTPGHDVYRLARNARSITSEGRGRIRIQTRKGRSREIELSRRPPGPTSLSARVNGRPTELPKLYASVSRPIVKR